MKDFCKWLGLNEKIAKIVVWILIFMCMLIIFNAAFDSLGLPYYKLTAKNLSNFENGKLIIILTSFIVGILNFFSIVFLVFRTKDFKKIFKYSLLYMVLNYIVYNNFNYIIIQVFVISFVLIFCFIYSNKNWKYVLYGLGAIIFNAIMQYICYLFKIQFTVFHSVGRVNQLLMSLDYFVLMAIIILVKEIIIKKRGEK